MTRERKAAEKRARRAARPDASNYAKANALHGARVPSSGGPRAQAWKFNRAVRNLLIQRILNVLP